MSTFQIIVKTFEYKIRETVEFVDKALAALDVSRFVYNCALEQRIEIYRRSKRNITHSEQSRQLTDARMEMIDLRSAANRAIQDNALLQLDRAFQAFYRKWRNGEKCGLPRFKSKARSRAFGQQIHQIQKPVLRGDRLTIPGVAVVRVRLSRPIDGRIKHLTIVHRVDGWYALLICECPRPQALPPNNVKVGIDVGLSVFATLSTGEAIENPKYLYRAQKALTRAQCRKDRKSRNSNNRTRALRQLRLSHLSIQRCRRDFHHKISTDIIKRFDSIAVEDLDIGSIVAATDHGLSVADAGWGQFFRFLKYKAENAGREFNRINPRYTSQTCSKCGQRQKMPLKCRVFICVCGLILDRDLNAARNIRQGMPKSTPVECTAVLDTSKQERMVSSDVNTTVSF